MAIYKQAYVWAIQKCADPDVGYSQDYRNQRTVNGITYYDCSSFINYALLAAQFVTPGYAPNHNAFTTPDEEAVLLKLGFKKYKANVQWLPGDILWRRGHTEMVYSVGKAMGARSSNLPLEDQVSIHDSSPKDWTYLYRYSSMVDNWYTKVRGGYERESLEAINNAYQILQVLSEKGWTVNAVSGILGNMDVESGYNPWRWQKDDVQSYKGSPWTNHGYGLVQFTPADKYIDSEKAEMYSGFGPNFIDAEGSEFDGVAQLEFVNNNDDGGYIKTDKYPLTYAQFKSSAMDAEDLASAWLYNYERPKSYASEDARRSAAAYWYNVFNGTHPIGGHNMQMDFIGGNGWILNTWASPDINVPKGTRCNLGYSYSDPHNGLPIPDLLYWRLDYGDGEIISSSYYIMGETNAKITGVFTGKTIDPTQPKGYNGLKSWYLKPWYIQNRGE